ncbi:DUF485 domain-containing protein [Methylobacterium sp. WL64]|nr:DUF485 domain-containing protein [Methylobacterium sp. WL64]
MFLMFFVFFGATLVTFAYLPDLVGVKVYGSINVAYLLAVSQFAVSFLIAAVYALWARKVLDPLTAEARARLAGC